MPVNGGASKPIQPSSRRSRVVVFDIDNALCIRASCEDLPHIREEHPECPIIMFRHKDKWSEEYTTYPHIFIPYLQILFEYLIKQGVRIVFFSSGDKQRNIPVITELLTSFWGTEKYEALKSKGQFDIFSIEHTREGLYRENVYYTYKKGTEGTNVKDLKVVVREGESLLDVILVEDDYSYTAYDQEPCLRVFDLFSWSWSLHKDSKDSRNNTNFAKNSVYYMLGLFKTYFENEKYEKLPLREFLIQFIIPQEREIYNEWFIETPFAHNLMDIGKISGILKV